MRHTKLKSPPIWRIFFSDKVYYFVIGLNKKSVIKTLKDSVSDELFGVPFKLEQVSPDDYNKILIQTDLEDEDSLTTLAEEAKYFIDHGLNNEFFIASSFDVIADSTLY